MHWYHFLIAESLPHLFSIINAPESRSNDNLMATENAISAIAKICIAYKTSQVFDFNQVIAQWVETLPLLEDEAEAPAVYSLLLDLGEANHPVVCSQDPVKIRKLVYIVTEVLIRPELLETHADITERMVKLLSSILSRCDPALRGSLWSQLEPETQSYLTSHHYV